MTRTFMIFGQGALRAHPFAFQEVNAVEKGDASAFDKAFWGHIGHVVRNLVRSIVLSVTRAHFCNLSGRRTFASLRSEVELGLGDFRDYGRYLHGLVGG